MQQEMVSVSVSIPLVDWGVRKGKYNMARNNLNVVKTSARQSEISIEEEVIMTVSDFNVQQALVASAEEALDLAILAYNETRQRFIIGQGRHQQPDPLAEPPAGSATQLHLRLAGLLAELLQDTETDVARLCQRIFAVGKI